MVSIGLEHVQVGRFGRSITATQMKGLTDGRTDGRMERAIMTVSLFRLGSERLSTAG